MGGFFSAPSAPSDPPPAATPTSDPEEEARKLRLENIARNRRGRAGMIGTSDRGVLEPTSGGSDSTKRLLGE